MVSKTVAIVGTGPAGRAAAREFIKAGWAVTMYEREPEPGGMMRYGFPERRMPTKVSRRDADQLRELGVQLEFNRELGADLTLDRLVADYTAVLLAVGSAIPRLLSIPGDDLPGVYDAITYLHAARVGQPLPTGTRVLVVGGGDTSLDVATTARELGAATVAIAYRGPAEGLRALPHEVEYATGHGVTLRYLTSVKAVEGAGDGLRMTLAGPHGTVVEDWDNLVVAIGQRRNQEFLERLGVSPRPDGSTDRPTVFVTGDAAYGSDRLAKAILDGRKVSQLIIRHA